MYDSSNGHFPGLPDLPFKGLLWIVFALPYVKQILSMPVR